MISFSGFIFRDLRGASKTRSLWVFCACLALGIALIAVCGTLLQVVRDGFDQQERRLFGGDLQISQRQNISATQLDWINANARVSRLLELRTMLGTPDGEFSVVELQSVDNAYPLYGQLRFEPDISLQDVVKQSDSGVWGAAFDPALTELMSLTVGDIVSIGDLQVELRAAILEQPDRSLRANFRGPPVIIDEGALQDSGLLQPTSLVDYEYRIRTDTDAVLWRQQLRDAFPNAEWEVQTVEERSEFVGRRLDQVASVLLLIGFSTLLIGGLGVANSVGAYMQTKLRTLATLQSLGARAPQVAAAYMSQIALLSLLASAAGATAGSVIAWVTAQTLSHRLPLQPDLQTMIVPTLLAIALGVCTALAFTLPTLGRTLSVPTATLIRGVVPAHTTTPRSYYIASLIVSLLALLILLWFVPEPGIVVLFISCIVVLLLLLEAIVQLIRAASRQISNSGILDRRFSLRLALASLHREGTSLRPLMLSLGLALTLLVTSALVIGATSRMLYDTVPDSAPSMVFYDLPKNQVQPFNTAVAKLEGYQSHVVAPLVLGRLTRVNGERLSDSAIAARALEANDEHKLSYRLQEIDNIRVDRGEWWPDDYTGPPLVAMEDREADQLGLQVGDELQFTIMEQAINVTLSAIYTQARFETSFWLEAVFTDNVLEPFIGRHIGSVTLSSGNDIAAQAKLAANFSNVVTIRTAKVLAASRSILGSAAMAMLMIAAVSLAASLLVMASVVAVNRQRQVYEATIMHAIGTRNSVVMRSVLIEYCLLIVVLSLFATIAGGLIAWLLLGQWLKIDMAGSAWLGPVVAIATSTLCLLAGAMWLMNTLKLTPATLLNRGA